MGGGGGSKNQTVTQQQSIDPNLAPYIYGNRGYLPQAYNLSQSPIPYYPGNTVAGFSPLQQQGFQNAIAGGQYSRQLALNAAPNVNQLLQGLNSPFIQQTRQAAVPAIQSLGELSRTGFVNGGFSLPQISAAQIRSAAAPSAQQAQAGQIGLLGFANPNQALSEFLGGSTGSLRNPYLDQLVSSAQESSRRGFEDLSQQASREYQANILPQIQQAQGLIPEAVRSFQEEILPSIRRDYQSGGAFGGSRQGLAEGLAASRLGETLAGQLGNLAQTAELSGNQTYQDILRNQSRAATDIGNIGAGLYGGAFSDAQNRALQAAGIGAGLQQGVQSALVSQGGLQNAANLQNAQLGTQADIERAALENARNIRQAELTTGANTSQAQLQADLLNSAQNRALQAAQGGLGSYLQAGALGTQQVLGGLGSLGDLSNLYGQLGQTQLGLGALQQQQQQAQINAAMQRYNYLQNEPLSRLQNYAALVNPLINSGGTSVQQQNLPGTNPFTTALGGATVGGTFGGFPGALLGGGLGLLGGYFF